MFLRTDMNLLQFSAEYNIILCATEEKVSNYKNMNVNPPAYIDWKFIATLFYEGKNYGVFRFC